MRKIQRNRHASDCVARNLLNSTAKLNKIFPVVGWKLNQILGISSKEYMNLDYRNKKRI
jgi:hypothetical protein